MSLLPGSLKVSANLNKLGSWDILLGAFPHLVIKLIVQLWLPSKPAFKSFHHLPFWQQKQLHVQLDQLQKLQTLPPPQFALLFLVLFLF